MKKKVRLFWASVVCVCLANWFGLRFALAADYLIGPEDVIEVIVWKEPELSRTVLVRPDGKISLPLIGDVKAQGFSSVELAHIIEQKLKEYIESPAVSVILKEINSPKIYILGKVNQPGMYYLRSRLTLLQAIALAGGFAEWAKKDKVIILRRVKGGDQRFEINIERIIKGKKNAQDIILQRGDRIIVP